MRIPLLILGTAPWGPDAEILQPATVEEAEERFGYDRFTTVTYAASATQATIAAEAWGDFVEALVWSGTEMVPLDLYDLAVSGTLITFGAPGATGQTLFRTRRIPEESDLVLAARSVVAAGGTTPALMRLPGTVASTDIDTAIRFYARHSGALGNGITLSVTGASLQVTVPDTLSRKILYYPFSTVGELGEAVNADFNRKVSPVRAEVRSPHATALSSGSYTLSGGADASVTTDAITGLIDSLLLDGIEVILVAGGPSTGILFQLLDYLDESGNYPTVVVAGSPTASASLDQAVHAAALAALPFTSSRLYFVPGFFTISAEEARTRRVPLSGAFAGAFVAAGEKSPTRFVTGIDGIEPFWTKEQLAALDDKLCPFTRFILSGYGPWRSGTTGADDIFATRLKLAAARQVHGLVERFIGEPPPPLNDMDNRVEQELAALPYVREVSVRTEFADGELTFYIDAVLYGEVSAVQFRLSTRL